MLLRRFPAQVPLLASVIGVVLLSLCASCASSTEIGASVPDEAVAVNAASTADTSTTATNVALPAIVFEAPRGTMRPAPDSAEEHLCVAIDDMLQSRLAFRSHIPLGQGDGPFTFEGEVRMSYYAMLNATEAARLVVEEEQPTVQHWRDVEIDHGLRAGSAAEGFDSGFLLAETQLRQSLFGSQAIPRNHATPAVMRTPTAPIANIGWQQCPDIDESLLTTPVGSVESLPGPSMRQEMMAMVAPRPEVVGGFCRQFEVLHTMRASFRESLAAVDAAEPATLLDAVDFYERFFDFEGLIEHDHAYSNELRISGDDARVIIPIEYSLAAVLEGDKGYSDDYLADAVDARSRYFINLAKRCPDLDHFALFATRDDDDIALMHALAEAVADHPGDSSAD